MLDANEFLDSLNTRPDVQAAYKQLGCDLHLEIVRARKRAGLTQEQVAQRMNTKKTAISRLESPRAKALPSMKTLERFAEATGHRVRIVLEPISPEN